MLSSSPFAGGEHAAPSVVRAERRRSLQLAASASFPAEGAPRPMSAVEPAAKPAAASLSSAPARAIVVVAASPAAVYRQRLRVMRFVSAAVGLAGLGCAMEATNIYQVNYAVPPLGTPAGTNYFALKIASTIMTVLLVISFAIAMHASFALDSVTGPWDMRDVSVFRRAPLLLAAQLLCLAACAVHAPVGISYTITDPETSISQSIDGILTVISLVRIFLVAPCFPELLGWTSVAARAAALIAGSKLTTDLALRVVLKAYPLQTLTGLFLTSVCGLAWAMKTAETSVCYAPEWISTCSAANGLRDLSRFGTNVWLTIVTMMTIGYGDVSPVTNFGKTIAVFAMFIGAVLNAMIVQTLFALV